jgi:hypothetical protein
MSEGARWQGYSHEELYRTLHSGPGPKASHASIERWEGISAALTEINAELHTGVLRSGAMWEGSAADEARADLNPLAAWADDAKAGAEVMRISAEVQADLVGKARVDMPPPMEVTAEQPGTLVSGLTHLLGGQTDYEVQEKAHDAAQDRAREVMATYASSTTSNTSTLGQFHQPPQLVINANQIAHAQGSPVVAAPVFAQSQTGQIAPVGGGGARSGAGRGRPGFSAQRTPAPASSESSSTGTKASGGGTSTSSASSSSPTSARVSGGTTAPGPSHVAPNAAVGGVTGDSGQDRRRKQREDDSDAHTGDATAVSSAHADAIAPAPLPSSSLHGHPAGLNAVIGAATIGAHDENVQHRPAAQPARQPGFDPFGGLGRSAEQEEDAEHHGADFLRETDDIYGLGEMVSPPVIGESTSS